MSVPIPANIPPSIVLAAIRSFTPLISNHVAADGFQEVCSDPTQTANDPFFPPWNDTIRTFRVRENISLAPGLYKEVYYQNVFQAVPAGARFRADAPTGIILHAEVTVRPRRSNTTPVSPTGSVSSGSSYTVETDEYELYDETVVEASSLVMPFILQKAQSCHKAICERLVAQAQKDYINGRLIA